MNLAKRAVNYLIYFYRVLINKIIVEPLVSLDFMHYSHQYIHGPKDRLIIEDKKRVGLVNTVFNTASGKIIIKSGVIFGHNCMVLTGKHNYEAKDIEKIRGFQECGRDIEIGESTWIASGAIILGNVRIGKYCVIAAGAVVTKDIPDYSFVAGVPAKVVKRV